MIFMLSKPGGKKKTEGLQYPKAMFVFRDSCFVKSIWWGLVLSRKKCLTARFSSARGRIIQTGNIRMGVNPA